MRVTRRRFLTGCSAAGMSDPVQPARVPSPLRPAILKACLARTGVTCRTCADACDDAAMRFALKPGGVALPHVLFQLCTGCGACAGACPVQAIAMHLPDGTAAI